MNSKQLNEYFDSLLPPALSCEWDNDGAMICTDPNKDIKKVLLTLDLTPNAFDKAVEIGADAIITHHPLIFRPIKNLGDNSEKTKILFSLIEKGISVFSYHTRLDAARGGVNDILADIVGIKEAKPLGEGDASMARVGEISKTTTSELALKLKRSLNCFSVIVALSKKNDYVSKVAVLGGAADKDFVKACISCGVHAFIVGELSYNAVLDANCEGLDIILCGHYNTEFPSLAFFEKKLEELDIESVTYDCGYFEYI